MDNNYLLLIVLTLLAVFIVSSLVFGFPSYLYYRNRSKKLEALAHEFTLKFEGKNGFWSFSPFLRFLYWNRPGGSIRRHIISGALGESDLYIYDSFSFFLVDFFAVVLDYDRLIKRTIFRVNGKIKGDMTPRRGFASIDQIRDLLNKLRSGSGSK